MDVIVIGGGGHARVVIGAILAAGHVPLGVYDDNPDLKGKTILDVPVLGPINQAVEGNAIAAIGNNSIRKIVVDGLKLNWVSIVHPFSYVDPSVIIGHGTLVCAGAVIQPEAQIEDHVIVNTMASVDHETRLRSFSQVGPGSHIGGNAVVEQGAFIGLGASVIQGLHIGKWSVIGAGATVIRNVEPNVTVVGTPANRLLT